MNISRDSSPNSISLPEIHLAAAIGDNSVTKTVFGLIDESTKPKTDISSGDGSSVTPFPSVEGLSVLHLVGAPSSQGLCGIAAAQRGARHVSLAASGEGEVKELQENIQRNCVLEAMIEHMEKDVATLTLQLMGSIPSVPEAVEVNVKFLKALLDVCKSDYKPEDSEEKEKDEMLVAAEKTEIMGAPEEDKAAVSSLAKELLDGLKRVGIFKDRLHWETKRQQEAREQAAKKNEEEAAQKKEDDEAKETTTTPEETKTTEDDGNKDSESKKKLHVDPTKECEAKPVAEAATTKEEEETTEGDPITPPLLSIVAETLDCGNSDHVEAVVNNCGGSGFDLVLLTDLVFAEIDDGKAQMILKTTGGCMAAEKRSKAYIVASSVEGHERFFAHCKSFGLVWKRVLDSSSSIVTEKNMVAFELTHHFDIAGAPLNPMDEFDCVVQGSGLTESFLSAALARAGYKVLHLDQSDQYGSAFLSSDLTNVGDAGVGTDKCTQTAYNGIHFNADSRKVDAEAEDQNAAFFAKRHIRRFLLDTIPLGFMANSDTIETLVESNTARSLEFQNVDRLLTLNPAKKIDDSGIDSSFNIVRVPLSRSDIFKSNILSPMDMRRLMKFIKDMDVLVPLEDSDTDDGENDQLPQSEEKKKEAAASHPKSALLGNNFFAFVKKEYSLNAKIIALLTLHQSLISPDATAAEGIKTLQKFMRSVGRWGGATPYLVPMYGCGEIPQNMCRVSAVWNGTFVLRRWVADVEEDGVILSNGQKVSSKLTILPEPDAPNAAEAAPADGLSRVVIVSEKALVSWKDLEKHCNDEPEDDDERENREQWAVPTVIAVLPHTKSDGTEVPIHVSQQSAATQQAPSQAGSSTFPTILHFSASSAVLPQQELDEVVRSLFVKDIAQEVKPVKDEEETAKDVDESEAEVSSPAPLGIQPQHVKLHYSFNIPVGVGATVTKTVTAPHLHFARTLFTDALLDDAAYIREAKRLFNIVVEEIPVGSMPHANKSGAKPSFLEEHVDATNFNAAECDADAGLLGLH